jgi:hypothetical protein
MCWTWFSAVRSAMWSRWAIWRLVRPRATRSAISRSRPVRPPWPARIAVQAVGQALRVGSQGLHAEPAGAARGVVRVDECFRAVFRAAAAGQDLRELV